MTYLTNIMSLFNFLRFSPSPPKAKPQEVSFDLVTNHVTTPCPESEATPRVPATGIPLEIVLSILEMSSMDDNNTSNTELLATCSLVCKAWSLHAQKLLFRRVQLCSQAAYNSFTSAVDRSTERGRALGDSVVQMRVLLDNNQPGPLKQISFATAVALCPNLRELNLALYGCGDPGKDIVGSPALERMRRPAPSFDQTTLELLRGGPSITSLHFSNWSDNDHSIVQLVDIWPSLDSLSITGKTPHLSPGLTHAPYTCQLERIKFNCQVEPSLDFLEWLLRTSAEAQSLRAIELEREPSLEMLEYLVGNHGEGLRTLALPSCVTREHANAVIKCERLRELRTERAFTCPVVFRQLPKGIKAFAFGMDQDTPLQYVVEAVKTRDELECVTVNIWNQGEKHAQLAALKMACAFRGVELCITNDVRVYRAMMALARL
ncbi:hypothetical protein F5I97DRAFT_1251897 [Phlebopus sp. FC_14]|nr:hypothetical protein F5I97DRAFT_1251897 [Phlebopus sp. FC_14]